MYDLLQVAGQQSELGFRSHAEIKGAIPGQVLQEIEGAEDSPTVEEGIRKFIEWVSLGKLEIKAYPSERLHAKVYIITFVEGHIDKGRVVTGSSNLSESGLQGNLEFNVELKNRPDYEFSLQKFEELWADAVEVSQAYVDTSSSFVERG